MYLMQCSLSKPEMALALMVKCDAPDAEEGAQLVTTVVKDTLARYLR